MPGMIDYTERLTALMRDIVERVPTLSFIDMAEVLVFARYGRIGSEGAFATCHCLNLPPTEPGYFFWRDRATGQHEHHENDCQKAADVGARHLAGSCNAGLFDGEHAFRIALESALNQQTFRVVANARAKQ